VASRRQTRASATAIRVRIYERADQCGAGRHRVDQNMFVDCMRAAAYRAESIEHRDS
jgi:hypothetical protein